MWKISSHKPITDGTLYGERIGRECRQEQDLKRIYKKKEVDIRLEERSRIWKNREKVARRNNAAKEYDGMSKGDDKGKQ